MEDQEQQTRLNPGDTIDLKARLSSEDLTVYGGLRAILKRRAHRAIMTNEAYEQERILLIRYLRDKIPELKLVEFTFDDGEVVCIGPKRPKED